MMKVIRRLASPSRVRRLAAILVAVSALSAACPAEAATPGQQGRPVVGLVLSGGGALGATHIGVLKVLEELNVPVDIITGTSMGSIVGGLYALGFNANELESLVAGVDWAKTFQDSPPRGALPVRRKQEDYGFLLNLKLGIKDGSLQLPAGLIQGQRLTLMLRELTVRAHNVTDFDELPIRFRAVAADLETGREVVLAGGNLATAMRASMSVPGILPPVEVDGRLLVDGGVANNLPVDVARALGAEVVIVVDIPTILKKRDQLTSTLDVAGQILNVLIQQNSLAQIASLGPRDILIQPDLGTRGATDFDRILEMIPPGEVAARGQAARLRELALQPEAFLAQREARGKERVETPVITFIDIDNRTKLADRRLRGGIRQRLGEPLDVQQIEDDFTKLYGLGVFEQIDYSLVERDGKTGLHVVATEKTWAKDYLRLGLALESDMEGESSYVLGFGMTLTALNAFGAEWRNEVAFGNAQRLITEFYQPLQPETDFYALASAAYTRTDGRVTGADGNISEYRTTRGDLTLALGREWGTYVDTRLGLRFGGGDVDRRAGSGGGVDTGSFRVGSLDARLIFDTLDNVHFPNDGTLVRMNLGASRQELGADTDYTKFNAGASQAYTWDANTVIAGITGGTALNGSLPTHDRLQLGGLFSVSGYSRNELSTENLLRGNLIYLRRLSERSSMFLDLPLYAGASFEAARLDGTAGGDFDRDVFGGSVFLGADTPLGAGYLALGRADGGRTALYLYLGKLF